MNFSTVDHGPSGPPGHLTSFAGEEIWALRSGALPAKTPAIHTDAS